MGGSLGLALKRREFPGTIVGYARRSATREYALEKVIVDEAFDDPAAAVREADLVVVCLPILATVDLVRDCRDGLRRGCLLTDVGSTKAEMVRGIEDALEGTGAVFVGSHPIAGSEQQGVEVARDNLYDDALVIVTPGSHAADSSEVRAICSFWESAGAKIEILSAQTHDEILARTSHLPHMIAAVLAATVARQTEGADVAAYCGTGFRDTSRIASGSPAVWMDIVQTNRESIVRELGEFQELLQQLIQRMHEERDEEVIGFLKHAGEVREALVSPGK